MKAKSRVVIAAIAALAAFGAVSQVQARPYHGDGPCTMGDGPGMPGGPGGFFDHRGPNKERATPLTESQVKDIAEGMIAWRGDATSVGAVKTVDGVISAEIVDADGKVVRTMAFDAKSGRPLRRTSPLTESQVKDMVAGMIAWRGEDAKVGALKTTDGVISAEIVGKDGKVLRTVAFDAKSGHPIRPAKPPKQ